MNIKEITENHPAILYFTVLSTGFIAGLGAYKTILEISQQQVISQSKYERLTSKAACKTTTTTPITKTIKVPVKIPTQSCVVAGEVLEIGTGSSGYFTLPSKISTNIKNYPPNLSTRCDS